MDSTNVALMIPPAVTIVTGSTSVAFVTGKAVLSNGAALSSALPAASEGREVPQEICSEARNPTTRCSLPVESAGLTQRGASCCVACVHLCHCAFPVLGLELAVAVGVALSFSNLQRVTALVWSASSVPGCLHPGKLMARWQPGLWEENSPGGGCGRHVRFNEVCGSVWGRLVPYP